MSHVLKELELLALVRNICDVHAEDCCRGQHQGRELEYCLFAIHRVSGRPMLAQMAYEEDYRNYFEPLRKALNLESVLEAICRHTEEKPGTIPATAFVLLLYSELFHDFWYNEHLRPLQRLLLKCGPRLARADTRNRFGETQLMVLIRMGISMEFLTTFMDHIPAVKDAINERHPADGSTAAHLCIKKNMADHLRLLEKRGADLSIQDNEGMTVRDWMAFVPKEDAGLNQLVSDGEREPGTNRGADDNAIGAVGVVLKKDVEQEPDAPHSIYLPCAPDLTPSQTNAVMVEYLRTELPALLECAKASLIVVPPRKPAGDVCPYPDGSEDARGWESANTVLEALLPVLEEMHSSNPDKLHIACFRDLRFGCRLPGPDEDKNWESDFDIAVLIIDKETEARCAVLFEVKSIDDARDVRRLKGKKALQQLCNHYEVLRKHVAVCPVAQPDNRTILEWITPCLALPKLPASQDVRRHPKEEETLHENFKAFIERSAKSSDSKLAGYSKIKPQLMTSFGMQTGKLKTLLEDILNASRELKKTLTVEESTKMRREYSTLLAWCIAHCMGVAVTQVSRIIDQDSQKEVAENKIKVALLTREQKEAFGSSLGPRARLIVGAAGTGKTLLGLQKLIDCHRFMDDQKCGRFLTYKQNIGLLSHARSQLAANETSRLIEVRPIEKGDLVDELLREHRENGAQFVVVDQLEDMLDSGADFLRMLSSVMNMTGFEMLWVTVNPFELCCNHRELLHEYCSRNSETCRVLHKRMRNTLEISMLLNKLDLSIPVSYYFGARPIKNPLAKGLSAFAEYYEPGDAADDSAVKNSSEALSRVLYKLILEGGIEVKSNPDPNQSAADHVFGVKEKSILVVDTGEHSVPGGTHDLLLRVEEFLIHDFLEVKKKDVGTLPSMAPLLIHAAWEGGIESHLREAEPEDWGQTRRLFPPIPQDAAVDTLLSHLNACLVSEETKAASKSLPLQAVISLVRRHVKWAQAKADHRFLPHLGKALNADDVEKMAKSLRELIVRHPRCAPVLHKSEVGGYEADVVVIWNLKAAADFTSSQLLGSIPSFLGESIARIMSRAKVMIVFAVETSWETGLNQMFGNVEKLRAAASSDNDDAPSSDETEMARKFMSGLDAGRREKLEQLAQSIRSNHVKDQSKQPNGTPIEFCLFARHKDTELPMVAHMAYWESPEMRYSLQLGSLLNMKDRKAICLLVCQYAKKKKPGKIPATAFALLLPFHIWFGFEFHEEIMKSVLDDYGQYLAPATTLNQFEETQLVVFIRLNLGSVILTSFMDKVPEAAAAVNMQGSEDGNTPAHLCLKFNLMEEFKVLLRHRAHLEIRDFTGTSVRDWAHRLGKAAVLPDAGANAGLQPASPMGPMFGTRTHLTSPADSSVLGLRLPSAPDLQASRTNDVMVEYLRNQLPGLLANADPSFVVMPPVTGDDECSSSEEVTPAERTGRAAERIVTRAVIEALKQLHKEEASLHVACFRNLKYGCQIASTGNREAEFDLIVFCSDVTTDVQAVVLFEIKSITSRRDVLRYSNSRQGSAGQQARTIATHALDQLCCHFDTFREHVGIRADVDWVTPCLALPNFPVDGDPRWREIQEQRLQQLWQDFLEAAHPRVAAYARIGPRLLTRTIFHDPDRLKSWFKGRIEWSMYMSNDEKAVRKREFSTALAWCIAHCMGTAVNAVSQRIDQGTAAKLSKYIVDPPTSGHHRRPLLIYGAAGTGKTWLALQSLVACERSGVINSGNKGVFLTRAKNIGLISLAERHLELSGTRHIEVRPIEMLDALMPIMTASLLEECPFVVLDQLEDFYCDREFLPDVLLEKLTIITGCSKMLWVIVNPFDVPFQHHEHFLTLLGSMDENKRLLSKRVRNTVEIGRLVGRMDASAVCLPLRLTADPVAFGAGGEGVAVFVEYFEEGEGSVALSRVLQQLVLGAALKDKDILLVDTNDSKGLGLPLELGTHLAQRFAKPRRATVPSWAPLVVQAPWVGPIENYLGDADLQEVCERFRSALSAATGNSRREIISISSDDTTLLVFQHCLDRYVRREDEWSDMSETFLNSVALQATISLVSRYAYSSSSARNSRVNDPHSHRITALHEAFLIPGPPDKLRTLICRHRCISMLNAKEIGGYEADVVVAWDALGSFYDGMPLSSVGSEPGNHHMSRILARAKALVVLVVPRTCERHLEKFIGPLAKFSPS